MAKNEVLKIPVTLYKVSTISTGGHRLTFDAPETAAGQVRELIGLENQQAFILCLVKAEQ